MGEGRNNTDLSFYVVYLLKARPLLAPETEAVGTTTPWTLGKSRWRRRSLVSWSMETSTTSSSEYSGTMLSFLSRSSSWSLKEMPRTGPLWGSVLGDCFCDEKYCCSERDGVMLNLCCKLPRKRISNCAVMVMQIYIQIIGSSILFERNIVVEFVGRKKKKKKWH